MMTKTHEKNYENGHHTIDDDRNAQKIMKNGHHTIDVYCR